MTCMFCGRQATHEIRKSPCCERCWQKLQSILEDEEDDLLEEQDNCENGTIAIEDRQPVVRCKDCKHGKKHNIDIIECMKAHDYNMEHQEFHHKNWFCADGERKDDDA